MKKILLLAAALLLTGLAPAAAVAQSEHADTMKMRPARGQRQMDPEKQLAQRVKHMTERYRLTEEQQTAVTALLKAQGEKFKGMPRRNMREQTQEQRDSMFKAMKQRREEFEAAMQKILTEEQFKLYQQDAQERMKQMQHRRRGPGQRPGGRGGRGFQK
jgi:Spy/CpxP family protein refolding chaperone